jgi:hypothetical protein
LKLLANLFLVISSKGELLSLPFILIGDKKMKKIFLLSALVLLVSGMTAFAQNTEYSSSRLSNLANNLKRQSVDLSDNVYRDYKNRYNANSRSETEQLFLAQQFDASAYVFQQLVRDNRPAQELRDAAAILGDLSRRTPSYGGNYLWRDAKRTIEDIDRELGGYGGGNGGGNYPGNGDDSSNALGRVIWRGTVDDVVQIDILNRALGVRVISGTSFGDGTYNFSSALPKNRNVKVYVIKRKGRGDVKIIQQPSNNNNGGAVIEVRDKDGGAKEYELEIYWK